MEAHARCKSQSCINLKNLKHIIGTSDDRNAVNSTDKNQVVCLCHAKAVIKQLALDDNNNKPNKLNGSFLNGLLDGSLLNKTLDILKKITIGIISIFVITSLILAIISGIEDCFNALVKTDPDNQLVIWPIQVLWPIYSLFTYVRWITLSMQQFTAHILKEFHQITIVYSIRMIYLYGPSFGHIGFWKGKEKPDICSQLYTLPSEHWKRYPEACENQIENEINSLVLAADFLAFLYFVFNYVKYLKRKKGMNSF